LKRGDYTGFTGLLFMYKFLYGSSFRIRPACRVKCGYQSLYMYGTATELNGLEIFICNVFD